MTTANMGLTVPTIGGTTFATELNADLSLIDAHDHSTGFGAPLTKFRTDPVSAYTASNVLTAAQSGSVITNQSATGSTTQTLPSATLNPGCYFQFITVAAQTIVVQATAGAVIQGTTGFSSANGTITCASANQTITLVAAAGNWYQRSTPLGTWTAA